MQDDTTLDEYLNKAQAEGSPINTDVIYSVIDGLDSVELSQESLSALVSELESLGEVEGNYISNLIVEEIKRRNIPGYEAITSIDEVLQIYTLLSQFQDIDINTMSTELKNVITSLSYLGDDKTGELLDNELFDYILAKAYPEFYEYTPDRGFELKDRSMLDQFGDIGSALVGLLPFFEMNSYQKFVFGDYRQTMSVAKALDDTLKQAPAIKQEAMDYISEVLRFAEVLVANKVGTATVDIEELKLNLVPMIIDFLASSDASEPIRNMLKSEAILKALFGIADLASYAIPYFGTAKLAEDVFKLFTDSEKKKDLVVKDTDLDLFSAYLSKIPTTVVRYANGIRYTFSPLLGNTIIMDNMNPLYKGKIVRIPNVDLNTIGNVLLKIPKIGTFGKAFNIGKNVIGYGLKLFNPVANVLRQFNFDFKGEFTKRDVSITYDFNPIYTNVVNEIETFEQGTSIINDTVIEIVKIVDKAIVAFDTVTKIVKPVIDTISTVTTSVVSETKEILAEFEQDASQDTLSNDPIVETLNDIKVIITDIVKEIPIIETLYEETVNEQISSDVVEFESESQTQLVEAITKIEQELEVIEDKTVYLENTPIENNTIESVLNVPSIVTATGKAKSVMSFLKSNFIESHIKENVQASVTTFEEEPDDKWKNYY